MLFISYWEQPLEISTEVHKYKEKATVTHFVVSSLIHLNFTNPEDCNFLTDKENVFLLPVSSFYTGKTEHPNKA